MNRHHFYTVGLLILLLAIAANTWLTLENIERVRHDEATTRQAAVFTRAEQVRGQPINVCLLDVMRNVAPLLERVPTVERPLQAYVRLQGDRYPSVHCPDK
jgi:hypothetical protein